MTFGGLRAPLFFTALMERLDFDPLTGIGTFIDFADGKMAISQKQDVSAILESNKESQKDEEALKRGMKESFVKVASIPPIVQLQWLEEGIDLMNPDHWPKVKAKLNDPEWRNIRTTLTRV